jgi:hypothetical protein
MALSISLFDPQLTYSHTLQFSDGATCDTLTIQGHTTDGEPLTLSLDLHQLSIPHRAILAQLNTPKDITAHLPTLDLAIDEIPF